jgi:hypothetical protein
MRLLLSRAEALKQTSGRSTENPGDAEQRFQIHMALAALELLPMARREAAIPPHVVLAPVPALSKSPKAKSKGLKEFVVHTRFVLRLHIFGLGGYEQNNHEQDSRFGRKPDDRTGSSIGLRARQNSVHSPQQAWCVALSNGPVPAPANGPSPTSKNTTSKKN